MQLNVAILLLVVCSYAEVKKPGTCPKPPLRGVCVDLCSSDEGCPGSQKCCSNGCGYTCQTPPTDTQKMCKFGSPLPSIFCGRGPNHQDCPRGYYCNIDPLDRFAVCCAQVKKPGTCPKPPLRGVCVDLCFSDEGCPGSQKCCSNGCGHTCQTPTVASPRTCPIPSGVGMCVEECSSDANCPAGQMCCSNGCGHTCQ
ncbi:hypothetical protein ACJMK2_042496 [Sinanodonta woodiana]|uniref:WAP domain-containing protein n=1 Tax=Sinanodonta woodiana TaxID=1069815 RepID=A0ABD3W7K7_SINWO